MQDSGVLGGGYQSEAPLLFVSPANNEYGVVYLAPPGLNFYAGISRGGWGSMFMWEGASRSAVTAGVNRYSHFFFGLAPEALKEPPPGGPGMKSLSCYVP